MRKIIACMILGLLSVVSCTEYDEVAMWNKNEDMGSRLASLEELCSRMNTNITSLQRIVEALQENDYVSGVIPVIENGETIGYTITFVKSGPVTIFHGEDGQNGTTPVIGVEQDADELYYWTLDGEWLTDDEGNKILAQGLTGKSAYELAVEKGYRGTLDEWLASLNGSNGDNGKSAYELAVENGYQGTEEEWLASLKGSTGDKGDDGVTPELEIRSDGYWYISYDDGQTWSQLGPATGDPGENGDSMFSDIDVSDPDYLVLTLAETGTSIKLPYYKDKFDLLFVSGSDKVKEMQVYCGPDVTVEVEYELTNPLNVPVAIEYISNSGYKVTVDKSTKKIAISAPDDPAAVGDSETILVFASDDERTIMRKLIVKQVKYIAYKATRQLDWNNSFSNPRFWGEDYEFIDEQSTYDSATDEGKWAYTGLLTWVEPNAFNSETDIRGVVLPEGIETIGSNAFNYSALETIELPESLITIDQYAFSNTNLAEITIPANVKYVKSSAFAGPSGGGSLLEKVVFAGNKIETIETNAFADCNSLKQVVLPEGLKTIGYNAFLRCSALEEITLPDAVTVIDKQAFSQCSALKKVILGTQLESIGTNVFNKCLALETVICPDETPATLGSGAFPVTDGWGYTANYRIYVPDDVVNAYRTAWPKYWDSSNAWKITQVIYGMSTMPQE